ncbi:MAG: DUF4924 family protein [Bacteroidales bacterium]
MIIARQKRRENLAEYILYMWQIEDLIRAFGFSSQRINAEIVQQYQQPDEVKAQILAWYEQLIQSMHDEQITREGHLRFLNTLVDEFHDFHTRLLSSPRESRYKELYQSAAPALQELSEKVSSRKMNEIESCLTGLYGILMLRLGKREISVQTAQGMKNISNMIACLADTFRKYEAGEYEI